MAAADATYPIKCTFRGGVVTKPESGGNWDKPLKQRAIRFDASGPGTIKFVASAKKAFFKCAGAHEEWQNKAGKPKAKTINEAWEHYIRNGELVVKGLGKTDVAVEGEDGVMDKGTLHGMMEQKVEFLVLEVEAAASYYPAHPTGKYPAGCNIQLIALLIAPPSDGAAPMDTTDDEDSE